MSSETQREGGKEGGVQRRKGGMEGVSEERVKCNPVVGILTLFSKSQIYCIVVAFNKGRGEMHYGPGVGRPPY